MYSELTDEFTNITKNQLLLERSNHILLAIDYISFLLLQSNGRPFKDVLLRSLEIMGKTAYVDRVYIWKIHQSGKDLSASQVSEWAGGAEPQQHTELVKNVPYGKSFLRWNKTFSARNCVNGMVNQFPKSEQQILSPQGIVSMLVAPVFLHNQSWGFVGFDHCHRAHTFSSIEEHFLRAFSKMIAYAVIRNQVEIHLQYLTKKSSSLFPQLTQLTKPLHLAEKLENLSKYAFNTLSAQELRIAELILQGYTLSESAHVLNITHNTAKGYYKSLYSKLQIHSRRELFELAHAREAEQVIEDDRYRINANVRE